MVGKLVETTVCVGVKGGSQIQSMVHTESVVARNSDIAALQLC